MVQLDGNTLNLTVMGGMLVTFGVVLKNTSEQLKMSSDAPMAMAGVAMFLTGWMITAVALSRSKSGFNTLKVIVPCIVIPMVVMVMKKMYMEKGEKPPMALPIMFAISWLVLGYFVNQNKPLMGILAAIMVLVSMLGALPWQRTNNVIDGPGLPLFVIAWFLIAYTNSVQ